MEHWYPAGLVLAHSRTAAAMARADERLRLTRHPLILRNRVRTLELEALGVVEGVAVLPDSLATRYGYEDEVVRLWPFTFARLTGQAPPLDELPDVTQVATWLEQAAISLPALADWRGAVATDWAPGEPIRLLVSADMAFEWQRRFPDAAVAGIMLADMFARHGEGGSTGGLAAVGFMTSGKRWRRLVQDAITPGLDAAESASRREQCRLQWLKALADGANEVVRLDEVITEWEHRVRSAVHDRRSSSQLCALCELIAVRPSTSVSQAASLLAVSRQSAARLIAEAEDLQLIREVTHGKYQRRYCATI